MRPSFAPLSFAAAASFVFALAVGGCQFVSGVSDMSFGAGGSAVVSGSGGAGGAGGSVAPLACKQASDCPPPVNPCEAPLCVAEKCGSVALPAGSKAAATAQKDGDCQVLVCNGEGKTVPKVDDADIFDDGSDCTDDLCVSGVPVAKPKAFGTNCGEGGFGKCDDTGKCRDCLSDGDCGPATECATPRCNAGACDAGAMPKGQPLGVQVPGDCQRRVCDGKGAVSAEADDTDVPNDGLDCTDDVCASGVPSNPPLAQGAMCGNAPSMTCDGKGACTGCTQPTDCSGSDDDCRARACTAGTCSIDKKPAGTKLPSDKQTAGDCKAKACTELGLVSDLADDKDPPADDGNACTTEACVDGSPLHPPALAGVMCSANGGKVCDGSGTCVGCNAGSDCMAMVGPCQVPACTSHACTVGNVPANQPAAEAAQKAGDCLVQRCDGNGGMMGSPFDADLPVDGEPCTQDVCTNGKPSNPAEAAGVACMSAGGGKQCNGSGKCVQCIADANCNGGHCNADGSCDNCQTKSCVTLGLTCGQSKDGCGGTLLCDDLNKNGLETDVDCGGDKATCGTRCATGQHCIADGDCVSGHCAQGVCCNVACDGACQSCVASDTGGKDGQCGFVQKGQDPLAQCPMGKSCDGAGACKGKQGEACTQASQCLSGFCPSQDGVCCDAACNGVCASCKMAKTGVDDGTCSPVVGDTDPDNDCIDQGAASCGKNGVCDGNASPACKLYPAKTVCKAGTCDAATLMQTAPTTCDGGGKCNVPGAMTACGGYACDATACKTTCLLDTDCDATHYCGVGGKCLAKKAQGVACGGDSQCTSTFCRDGFCCNSDCGDTCSACAKAKSGGLDGTCSVIPLAADPDNECNAATPICAGGSASCAACGATVTAPGAAMCPAECTGGCDAGTTTCKINCLTENSCKNLALTCPSGWNCSVTCNGNTACSAATITCPSNYACNVSCGGTGQNVCFGAKILCANGNCNLACKGQGDNGACRSVSVTCGGNQCKTTCDVAYNKNFPALTANGACSCTNCGNVACL